MAVTQGGTAAQGGTTTKRGSTRTSSHASHSIFVTNFPSGLTARQLWDICTQYGKVIDAFIPARLSKEGKRFAFVRYVKVDDLDLLVDNLNTIWVGRFKLRFNLARFQRIAKNMTPPKPIGDQVSNKPLMVLDEECLSNKRNLMLVAKFQTHEGVQSWFEIIKPWYPEFKVDDRVTWVDVEGLPTVAWTNATFKKLAGRWGRLLVVKDHTNNSWDPDFIEEESEEGSEEEDEGIEDSSPYTDNCSGIYSNGEQLDDMLQEHKQSAGYKSDDPFGNYDILHKEELAKDNKKEHETIDDPSHPPGFTNSVEEPTKVNKQEDICGMEEGSENVLKHGNKSVTQMMGSGIKKTTSVGASSVRSGRPPRVASSLLNKLNEFVEIGQAMGFSMKGCLNNIEELVSEQGVIFTTK
ncbi:RNA-directed DNA polymerase, eukaryota, nucleotide-binding alpha-beta plait domain protein [Tanacetum coccineum]